MDETEALKVFALGMLFFQVVLSNQPVLKERFRRFSWSKSSEHGSEHSILILQTIQEVNDTKEFTYTEGL